MNEEDIRKNVEEVIREVIAEESNGDKIVMMQLTDSLESYCINSLKMVQIMIGIESKFNIRFEFQDFNIANYKTLEDLILAIEKIINNK